MLTTVLSIIFALFLVAGVILLPVMLSRGFVFWGYLPNDHFMITEDNRSFSGMKLRSDTHQFVGGKHKSDRWKIEEKEGTPMSSWEKTTGTFWLGGVWPIAQAKKVVIPLNSLDVIRPKNPNDELEYVIKSQNHIYQAIPRNLNHAFQTRPVETMGDRNGQCKIGDSATLVALVTEILMVRFKIVNPYLAFMQVQDDQGNMNFMQHLNTTLQSVARQVTATFTYDQIIKAKTEGEDATLKESFGKKFKELANGSLKRYGIEITDIDLVDHHLDAETQSALLAPQREKMKAEGIIIKAQGERKRKEEEAEGDAAVIRTIMREVGGNKELALAELARRGQTDAAAMAGKSFNGQFLTLNIGGSGNTASGPIPAVNVGSVDQKPAGNKHQGNNKHKQPRKR